MIRDIKIGTMLHGKELGSTLKYIDGLAKLGFESVEITFGSDAVWIADLPAYAAAVCERVKMNGLELSAVGVYSNTLGTSEADLRTRRSFELLIDNAAAFGCSIVAGFAGRVPDMPMSDSIPRFKEVFSELAARAEDKNVRIAFENCIGGGTWNTGSCNIAVNPLMWELMFDAVPSKNLGLEWEPTHQACQLIDPIPQLREWAHRIFHVHGKDYTLCRDVIARWGIHSGKPYIYHRTPGFGDTNWTDVISILRMNKFAGNIDIEGWHDPVCRGELEMTGQVHALEYLKNCRGGTFVSNIC